MSESYLYVDLLGHPGLYDCSKDISMPEGLYGYYLGDPEGYDFPTIISETPCADHWGTVLLREPINLNEVRDISFYFYEDTHGNPLPLTMEEYLGGIEPTGLQMESGTEDDLCL